MFLHITVNQLRGQPIILRVANMLLFSLYYDIIIKPNKSKNHTRISFITWFCRKSNCLLGFQNSK